MSSSSHGHLPLLAHPTRRKPRAQQVVTTLSSGVPESPTSYPMKPLETLLGRDIANDEERVECAYNELNNDPVARAKMWDGGRAWKGRGKYLRRVWGRQARCADTVQRLLIDLRGTAPLPFPGTFAGQIGIRRSPKDCPVFPSPGISSRSADNPL